MNCPSCGKPSQTVVCPYCGMDADVYVKIAARSNAHYNRALVLARNDDLTGAMAHLSRSLVYNKMHIDARNLLGLILCETGRIGEALKHWVISVSLQPKDNPADAYMAQFQKNPRRLEMLSNAVRMYNRARNAHVQQKNEDVAIIQLKKAVEMSPHFVDALNMLALSYMMSRDRTRAQQCVDRVLALDKGNLTAWRYYRELSTGARAPEPRRAQTQEKRAEKPASYPAFPSMAKSGLPISGIISFLVGAVCAFAVAYILFVPQQVMERDTLIDDLRGQLSDLSTANSAALAAKESEILTLTQEKERLENENKSLSSRMTAKEKENVVYSALNLFNEDKMEEAVRQLRAVVPSDLTEELRAIYTNVDQTAKQSLEKKNYDTGVVAFNGRRYDDARTAFLLAEEYAAAESTMADNTLFYLGQIAEQGDDPASLQAAILYYQRVVAYPGSDRVNQAQARLNALLPSPSPTASAGAGGL